MTAEPKGKIMMAENIVVSLSDVGRWSVARHTQRQPLAHFKKQCHALAYGRAMAFSLQCAMFVVGRDGRVMPQTASSLTYPTLRN